MPKINDEVEELKKRIKKIEDILERIEGHDGIKNWKKYLPVEEQLTLKLEKV